MFAFYDQPTINKSFRVLLTIFMFIFFSFKIYDINLKMYNAEHKPVLLQEVTNISVSMYSLDNNTAFFQRDNTTFKLTNLNCKSHDVKKFITKIQTVQISVLNGNDVDIDSICRLIK